MVISSEFRFGQSRDDEHREEVPQLLKMKLNFFEIFHKPGLSWSTSLLNSSKRIKWKTEPQKSPRPGLVRMLGRRPVHGQTLSCSKLLYLFMNSPMSHIIWANIDPIWFLWQCSYNFCSNFCQVQNTENMLKNIFVKLLFQTRYINTERTRNASTQCR